MIQNKREYSITSIRTDYGREFDYKYFKIFCDENNFDHNFLDPRTRQQNVVVEMKNRILQEMGRTMFCENSLPKYFWSEAVNTSCYVLNRIFFKRF